jgi:peptidoglycan biosynthesis protein MviN/MurJ (putative lipid II flippase)
MSVSFYLLFIIRRLLYVGIAFAEPLDPCMKVLMLYVINLLTGVYISHWKPYSNRLLNRLVVVNEGMVGVSTVMMLLFTNWVDDPTVQTNYGWLLYIIVGMVVLVN